MPDPLPRRLHPPASWAVQAVCYAGLGGVLMYVIVARFFYPLTVSDSMEIAAGKIEDVEQGIDPNVADWPELASLPGIGEVIAKRIVDYRRQHASGDSRPVFQSPQDLEPVSGIGPKKLEQIGPFLKFSTTAPASAPPR